MVKQMKGKIINFKNTDHPLGYDQDKGVTRARIYTDPVILQGGSHSTCVS